MAVVVGSIEEIQRSAEEIRFQWKIRYSLSRNPSRDFFSPTISWHDASWSMWVWHDRERLELDLYRLDEGPPFTLKVSVGWRGPAGVQHQREMEGEIPGGYHWYVWDGDSSLQLADVRSNLMQSDGSLVVWCEMKVPARDASIETEGEAVAEGSDTSVRQDPCPEIPSEATNEGVASSSKRGREEEQTLKVEIKTLQERVKKHKLEEEHYRKMADVHKNMVDGYKCQLEGKMTLLSRLERGQQSSAHCVVCLENPVDSVLYRCGHMCLCYGCAFRLKTSNSKCPICRCDIQDVIKFYR